MDLNISPGAGLTSMNHRAGLDRSQTLLFPERLEDYIARRKPRALPGRLRRLAGFARAGFCQGPVAPTPAVRLTTRRRCSSSISTVICIGFVPRRLLEAECQRNVEVIWLLGKLAPDFKTIADFRKDNLKPLQAGERGSSRCCAGSWNCSGANCWPLTGASSGRSTRGTRTSTRPNCEDLIARADARLAEYLQATGRGGCGRTGAARP